MVDPFGNVKNLSLRLYVATPCSIFSIGAMWLFKSSLYVLRVIRILIPAKNSASSTAHHLTNQDLPPPRAPPYATYLLRALNVALCFSLGFGICRVMLADILAQLSLQHHGDLICGIALCLSLQMCNPCLLFTQVGLALDHVDVLDIFEYTGEVLHAL